MTARPNHDESATLIKLEGVRVVRQGTILERIDWEVRRGERWAVLGPNGSGKSSLLAVLCGYLIPTAGCVKLLGHEYGRSEWQKLKEQVGLVSSVVANLVEPLESAREVALSGRFGMINFWGKASKVDRDDALRALRQADAAAVADRPWVQLSQGERQRVLIARALMSECRVLILDEPCAGLDPVARENFLNFIEGFGRRPRSPAIILVTHHVEEITPVFTHALLLGARGTVAAAGPVKKTLTSENLAKAFDAPLVLRRAGPRYRLELKS